MNFVTRSVQIIISLKIEEKKIKEEKPFLWRNIFLFQMLKSAQLFLKLALSLLGPAAPETSVKGLVFSFFCFVQSQLNKQGPRSGLFSECILIKCKFYFINLFLLCFCCIQVFYCQTMILCDLLYSVLFPTVNYELLRSSVGYCVSCATVEGV